MKHNNVQSHSIQSHRVQNHPAWRGRTVLVTGLSGFVGSWLANALLDQGAEVIGIVRPRRHKPDRITSVELLELDRRASLVQGSIADYPTVERVMKDYAVDSVFHLAAETIVGAAKQSPLSFFESNIKGTWNLLEAVRNHPQITRVVVASSDKAYGDQTDLPYTEESTLNGLYPYDASKACTDILARTYAHTYDLPIVVTRLANVYGGADLNWSRLVPGTIRSIVANKNPVLRSDGTSQRDYIYKDDAVDAYLQAGEHAARADVRGRAFNFGSGLPVSARGMVEMLIECADATHLTPEVQGKGKAHGEIDRQFLDSSQAHVTFGWKPKTELASGLRHTINWFQEHVHTLKLLTSSWAVVASGGEQLVGLLPL